ncbi:MAG: translation initiation factor IF-2 [Candidatus Paracaedibacteraceae bacterium]|nr:translation initiation factor IF-2 [Candidatus Paracaedibacteraceae bacterium]
MTDDNKTPQKDRKPLTLSKELTKNIGNEEDRVRQSFTHGRSKSVVVEVKKRRLSGGGKESSLEEKLSGNLKTEEIQARLQALKQAQKETSESKETEVEEAIPLAYENVEAVEEREKNSSETLSPESPKEKERFKAATDEEGESEVQATKKRQVPLPRSVRDAERRQTKKVNVQVALDENYDGGKKRSMASIKRAREKERRKAIESGAIQKVIRTVLLPEVITVQELASRMAEKGVDVIRALMKMGMMVTINQIIDADTAELIISEFGHKVERVGNSDIESEILNQEDNVADLLPRPPVVTIMGHVDHGKTSLLDALRQTDVAAKEAGGITQHIGAYQILMPNGKRITFIDTPGHEAFSEMRSRGANVTDIVVLVVAADDGIKEQTIEAINHAKAAGVAIIVAINKIDKPEADPMRVRHELLSHEIVLEEFGGDILSVEVSAKKKIGLEKLEETILLQAEMLDMSANPNRSADGTIVEARLEKGRGSIATVLVERGTLKIGDLFVAGAETGRIRLLQDSHGQSVKSVGPGTPVEVMGFGGVPVAGDKFLVVESEAQAKAISERYRQKYQDERNKVLSQQHRSLLTMDEDGKHQWLNVIIKADVHGSLEAIAASLLKVQHEEISVRVMHGGVGGITESDISLANTSNAMVIAFNVRATPQAKEAAARNGVDIRYYSIIYEAIDDVKKAMSGLLSPDLKENFLGYAEIRQVFTITGSGKIAGCMITSGTVKRGCKVRLIRDNVVIHEGDLKSLRREKEEVKEVREGFECGIALQSYQDIKEKDMIECFEVEEIARVVS